MVDIPHKMLGKLESCLSTAGRSKGHTAVIMNETRKADSPARTGPHDGLPDGDPAIRTIAMPADANANGDIFGGWLMAQMDLAGAVAAIRRAGGRVATVAVDAMEFHRPVMIGDLLSCYATIVKVGHSSIAVDIESWVQRRYSGTAEKVTQGRFTYVAIDETGRPRPVPKE
jgi:acyl-CoA thioesterase YciA